MRDQYESKSEKDIPTESDECWVHIGEHHNPTIPSVNKQDQTSQHTSRLLMVPNQRVRDPQGNTRAKITRNKKVITVNMAGGKHTKGDDQLPLEW
jgi:hypothetical protein